VVKQWRRPWSVLLAWLALCLSAGSLLARFVGIAMEAPSNLKQWMLVGVELAICAVAALWIRYRRDAPDRAQAGAAGTDAE
jgi:membrane protein DedA with SNARE-associated domain